MERENYASVYDAIGKDVTIDQVTEKENGKAYVTVNGVEYELGMDFLSMAMVYNVRPTEQFPTPTDVYNEWWRLFMQRWNSLVPEVPLYSNQYYDIYNAKIDRLQTNPYWDVCDAIVGAKVVSGENAVILGGKTELTGAFRASAFGKSAPNAADLDIETLTSGYSTVVTDMGGSFVWASSEILREHREQEHDDGTKTFTVRIADDLVFSDGTKITAGRGETAQAQVTAGSLHVPSGERTAVTFEGDAVGDDIEYGRGLVICLSRGIQCQARSVRCRKGRDDRSRFDPGIPPRKNGIDTADSTCAGKDHSAAVGNRGGACRSTPDFQQSPGRNNGTGCRTARDIHLSAGGDFELVCFSSVVNECGLTAADCLVG